MVRLGLVKDGLACTGQGSDIIESNKFLHSSISLAFRVSKGAFHLVKKLRKFRCEFPGLFLLAKVVPFCCKFCLC